MWYTGLFPANRPTLLKVGESEGIIIITHTYWSPVDLNYGSSEVDNLINQILELILKQTNIIDCKLVILSANKL